MKMMKAIISLTFVLAVLFANAGNINDNDGINNTTETAMVVIKGKIIDSDTKEPLVGVKIYNENGSAVYTDFDGNFELKTNKSNKEVKVSYISYEDTVLELSDRNNNTIEINQID